MEKSDYQKRIALEKRGVDTEDLTKRDLQNERKLIQRAKMDRELERQGMLNYQTGAGGKQAPPPQSLAPHVQPSLYPTPTPPQSLAPQTGGGSSVLQDPVTGKEYYSQGQQYYLNGQPRVSNSSVWLNGQPKTASPLSAGGGLATLQDAVNGQVNWSDVSVEQRKKALSDPNFYANNQITKYPKWMQQEILADPNFDWKKLPKWQKYYFDLSSSPLGMGAVQGGLMGSFGGPVAGVGGTALGAGLGWAAGKSGYDATKEAWQQTTRTAKVFGYLNWAAEQAEKVVGLGVQAVGAAQDPNVELKDVFTREGWDAGAVTFETITPAIQAALKQDSIWNGDGEFQMRDLLKFLPSLDMTRRLGDLVLHPEKYKGDELYLGADMPVALDQNFQERINEARERIKQGENYREVMMDFQTGVMGQLGDMAGQAIADPLNVLPQANAKLLGKAAELSGNKVAAEAFKGVDAPVEGLQRYKNLVQTGEALKIDPNFKVDEMGALARWAAGVNKQGQIKAGPFNEAGLLDAPKKNKTGFLQEMVTLPPQSRAQTGAGMFYENIGALLTRFDDPHEAVKYLRALSNNDMETWRELGSRFAESPEFYTVLPALKDFNGKALDGIAAAWDNTQMNRDTLTRVADILGQEPGKLLDEWQGKDTFEQDFGRIRQRLEGSSDPAAKALLGEMQAGRFTPDSLKQMVDVFTGDGAAAWHPNQAKAMMLDALGEHFDKWVAERLMLDQTPEAKSAFFRTAALMKSAQSILLLGASPGYAIQNGLSNMVHRAATGNFGYLTPTQINGFMEKFGVSPARFDEGVGIGGMVEQAAGKGKVHSEAQIKAVKGKGALTDAREKVSAISGKMPFSKLSSWFEKNEGRQAFVIGMKQFWGQSWRRGKGFKTMSPELVAVLNGMGVDPNHFYAAIEAGLNQKDIETALLGRQTGIQARALVEAAAQKTGLTASQAADMLEKVGVMDTLDSFLKGQTTNDGKRAAFRRAERVAQDWMDRQAGEDLKAQAEHVAQRVTIEQPAAAFEVIQKTLQDFTDTWMEHYYDLGEVTRNLEFIPDEAMKSKAYDHAYEVSGERFRRIDARSAASWQGIFEAWGKSNDPRAKEALSAMGEMRSVMADAYTQMRDIRKATHEKHRGNLRSSEFFDDVAKDQKTIDQIFKRAFETRKLAEKRAGKALGDIYESLYGPAAGEAARLWWDDVLKMNDEIVKREGEFRKSIEGLSKEERAAAKQKYYAETKALQIVEQLRINEEGLARLERVVRKGGQGSADSGQPTTPPPTPPQTTSTFGEGGQAPSPQPSPLQGEGVSLVDDVNGLMAAAEQRKNVEAAEQRARVASVWDVAEEYARVGLPYDRGILQDRFALIGALRKAEYGGLPDLTGLNDPRLTPELVRQVMEARLRAKEADVQKSIGGVIARAEEAMNTVRIPKINENTTILRAVAEHGGLRLDQALTLTGEKRPKSAPGVFTKKGVDIDEMARMLADDGYPIDVNAVDDPGGIAQTTALLERARRGDKVYPMGHDHDAMIARTMDDAAMKAFEDAISEQLAVSSQPFDVEAWQRGFNEAAEAGDLTALYERMGELDEAISDQPSGVSANETWGQYVSRVADEVVARVEEAGREVSIEEAKARADEAVKAQEVRGEFVMTRNLLKEKFVEVFGITEEQATAWMEISDGVAGWYERAGGGSGEEFYSRYYKDVVSSDQSAVGGEALEQGQLQPVNRRMTAQEVGDYARALVRGGADELRRAVVNEPVKADRIAILNEAHKLDAKMAEGVAKANLDVLFQDGEFKAADASTTATPPLSAKGAVVFDGDGIKATIHAFEGKDFSTVVHENAHVFRRMLSDVAERTGDARVKKDLATIEEWAGVKDGQWNRAAEEKFARGFERYLAEGKAPTPALKRAFDSFKHWMLAIYKSFTGSAIDVKLTPSVKAVFDNLVAGDDATRNIGIFSKDLYVDVDALRANLVKRNEAIKARMAEIREKSQVSSSTLFQRAEAVDTPEFKNWFGKSKVVGEDGKPLVVYHGTGADFQVFDAGKVGLNFSDKEGFFFTDNVSHDTPLHGYDSGGNEIRAYYEDPYSAGGYAKNAARQTGQGAAVMPVYLKLENPMTTKDVADMFSLKKDDPFDGAHPQDYLDDNKQQLLEIAKEEGYDGIWLTNGKDNVYVAFEPTQVKSVANRGTFDPTDPNILFQDADLPVGSLDAASGFMPQSAVMEEGWGRHIKPLLEAMEEEAISRQQSGFSGEGAMKDMSPEGQGMLRKYMKEVQNDMATSKLAAMRWGEQRRDFAMLNYNRRYGFDRWLDVVYPYQFFYSRSLMTWAARGLDTPAWFSNYARLRMQQQRYERDIPERLRNKIKIPAPWMPDWMGDALYIDPLQSLFTPANFLRPFERMERDKNMQQVEAERIMQEWAEDGTYSQEQIMQAAQSQSGSVWERAQQEAVMRRESEISSPMDFFNTMFGPAWYLSTPMNLLGIGKGEPNKMTNLPLTNTARGIEAVTQGTWAEPVGQVIGLLGKPEEWARKKLGLPTMGEYGEYYTKRQLANMVIEGKITSEQAQLAMIEKQGALWDEATQRVKLELAMRVPTMASLYAGLHGKNVLDGLTQAGAAALPSLFGSGLLPAGELEYRGLKQEWDEAWKKFDAGDKQAVTAFFDEHPEYEAYLAKGKDDDELMQSFLVGQVWDGYMALGPTNQKAARAQMGELFGDAFLNKETRSYESIPTEQLMEWARMLNKMTPQLAPQASPQMTPSAQFGGSAPTLNLYDKNVTAITDEFFNQRSQYFPDYYEVQNGYYALPKSGRAGYLLAHPELKEYWDWKKKWEKSYPDLVPIMKGQVFKTVDTSTWPPGLETYVQAYAYGGERLPKGAYKALEQQWIMEGRPYDDLNVWLNSQVVPAMLYQDQPSP